MSSYLQVLKDLGERITVAKWFLPLAWAADITARALKEERVKPQTINTIVKEIGLIRENLTSIVSYDWVSVPLVYTQVGTKKKFQKNPAVGLLKVRFNSLF